VSGTDRETWRQPQGFETRAIHAGQRPDPATGAVVTPLYLTSTFEHSAPGEFKGYDYSRAGNPTRAAFESCLASLEGARHGFAFASGCVGTATVAHLLAAGDHVVACDDMYGGTYRLFEQVFRRYGIDFSYVDLTDADALAGALRSETRLVWIESPTNPLMKLIDIARVAELAHEADAWLMVDNTFMSPYLQRPIGLGADLVLHSTTKYINGHSDCLGGVVATDDAEWQERLLFAQKALGLQPSPFDTWLTARGAKTLALRMERHCANALTLAEHLERHPQVRWVRYPFLASHPQHRLARTQMGGGSGIVALELDAPLDACIAACKRLRLFTLAESLGGIESLACHPASMTHASVPAAVRAEVGIGDSLVRLSVGIEDAGDLIADLDRALEQL